MFAWTYQPWCCVFLSQQNNINGLSAVKTISQTARSSSLPPPPPVLVPLCVLAWSASSLLSVKAPMLLPRFRPPSPGNNQFIEIILANEIFFNIFLSPAMTIHTCWYSPNQTRQTKPSILMSSASVDDEPPKGIDVTFHSLHLMRVAELPLLCMLDTNGLARKSVYRLNFMSCLSYRYSVLFIPPLKIIWSLKSN